MSVFSLFVVKIWMELTLVGLFISCYHYWFIAVDFNDGCVCLWIIDATVAIITRAVSGEFETNICYNWPMKSRGRGGIIFIGSAEIRVSIDDIIKIGFGKSLFDVDAKQNKQNKKKTIEFKFCLFPFYLLMFQSS